MKISNIFAPIRKGINHIKGKAPKTETKPSEDKTMSALEAMDVQNRVLVKPNNMVKPLQTEFKSTKELFSYAKKRCTDALKSDKPYEHTVLVDTKQNKVLAEYKGNVNECEIKDFDKFVKNPDDTILIHGHPNNHPLSNPDVKLLLSYDVNQVMAVNKNGEFSLAAKRAGRQETSATKSAAETYQNNAKEINEEFWGHKECELYKEFNNDNLKKYADGMGLRYVTNYSSFKNNMQ